MQYYFQDKCIGSLCILPNIFLIDHHRKSSIRNLWKPTKCLKFLMFHHAVNEDQNPINNAPIPFTYCSNYTYKRGLGQGNIFIGVCQSFWGPLYDVTSCLAAWSHVLWGRGSPMLLPAGLCPERLCPEEGLCLGASVQKPPPVRLGEAVRILLKWFLVSFCFSSKTMGPMQ